MFTFLFVACVCRCFGKLLLSGTFMVTGSVYHPEGREGRWGGREEGEDFWKKHGRKRDSHILKVILGCQTSFCLQYGPKMATTYLELVDVAHPPYQAESDGSGMIVRIVCL